MEYQLYGGKTLAMNSNVPNQMNNYTMPMMNTYGAYNYYNPTMQGYNYSYNQQPATNFGQNIPAGYTSAASNITNASNNTQAQQAQGGESVFKGLNQQDTEALKKCYVNAQEPSEGLLGAAFGGITMGIMNNPRYIAHPINSISATNGIKEMFSSVKTSGSALNKLWTNKETNEILREAYFQMHKATARSKSKLGLFRKRYSETEFNALKDIMDKALKSGNADEIAKASETLKNAYVNNGHIPTLWQKAKAWVTGKEFKPVDIIDKTKNADEVAKIAENASKLVSNSKQLSYGQILKKGGGVKGALLMAGIEFAMGLGKIKTAFEKDKESGMKQLGQTTVKAAGNAAGWMFGEAAGIWASTKLCASIGTALGPGVGTVVGGLLGLIGGSLGMCIMGKITKGVVGEDVSSKIEAEKLAQTQEGQAQLLQIAAQQAQDGKADQATQQALMKILQSQQAMA